MVSANITPNPFGDALRGHQAFRTHHNLDDPTSEFWSTMEHLLANGSAVDGCDDPEGQCRVSYPYWTYRIPDGLDYLDHAVTRQDVAMYASASANSAIVERLSYEVVKRVIDQSRAIAEGWEEVALLDGRRGFIREEDRYRLTGYRMTFIVEATGAWVLGDFLAGD